MYYKIVTPQSFFTDLYDDIDVFNIPVGTVFTAPDQSQYKPDDPKCLLGNSCFHFAQGAFDTMLWHTKLIHHTLPARIYQIQPLTARSQNKDAKIAMEFINVVRIKSRF